MGLHTHSLVLIVPLFSCRVGRARLAAFVTERKEWCISRSVFGRCGGGVSAAAAALSERLVPRQRFWGVPIPVFYRRDSGEPVCTPVRKYIIDKIYIELICN